MTNLQSLDFYWPELILTGVIVLAIILDLLLDKKDSGKVGWVLILGLITVALAIYIQDGTKTTTLFMDSIVLDPFASFFKMLVILATIFVSVVSWQTGELAEYRKGEYFTLLGIIVLGLFLMVSAVDLVMVYLSIEMVSIMSFILAGYLKQNTRSNEAGLKYVVYGAFSSGIMLFGISILYGLAGSTNYFEVQQAVVNLDETANAALVMALVMILAGFGYKISAVPFHFWTPDVYEGAPITITAYLSVAPKAGALAMMIRFFNQVLADGGAMIGIEGVSMTNMPWPEILALLAVITMSLGNLVAIQQNNLKRMLAYSSIAHAGYMLMVFPTISSEGVFAIMIYLVMYLFMNLGAFFVLIYVSQKQGGENFEHFSGLGWRMPIVGIVMSVFMFSLTGLPPTVGFIGKFYLFVAVINAGSSFYWIAFFGAINTVVSLYYYMRVVKTMYLDGEPSEEIAVPPFSMTIIFLLLAIPSVFFGIYWTPILNWVKDSLLFFVQI